MEFTNVTQLESALINAMKNAMSIEDGFESDGSVETQYPNLHNHPTEWVQVRIHMYNQNVHSHVVLEEYLVEGSTYTGSEQLGDQDQYALVLNQKILKLTSVELLSNTWIEFIVKKNRTFEDKLGDASIFLRTDYISEDCDESPQHIELIDRDYRYVLTTTVVLEDGVFTFTKLAIQPIL
jgi:hypothetical protein